MTEGSSSKNQLPIVYSCSGCSSAAQVANDVAIAMDRRGAAEMSCIAGVGGDVAPLVNLAKSGRDIIVLDGCPLQCAKHCLARHGVKPTSHYVLSAYGVRKRQHVDPDPEETERVLNEVMKDAFGQKTAAEGDRREVA